MHKDIYLRKPLSIKNGIPIFSRISKYTNNYEEISRDHCKNLITDINPFISKDLWEDTENSTINLIRKQNFKTCKILDVGVGLGRILDNFPNYERYGMDISQTYLEISKNKGINVCFSLIEDCPYKDNTFDLIICTDVLEHVIDMNIAVQNMLRVLKKGGVLILRVPYRENLKDYVENNTYEFVHLRNFDEYELQLMFTKIFPSTIIDVKKAGYDSFVLRILRQKIKSRFLISITKFVYRKLSNIFPENLLFNYVEINMVVKK